MFEIPSSLHFNFHTSSSSRTSYLLIKKIKNLFYKKSSDDDQTKSVGRQKLERLKPKLSLATDLKKKEMLTNEKKERKTVTNIHTLTKRDAVNENNERKKYEIKERQRKTKNKETEK